MNVERSLGNIFSDLLAEITALFRDEIRLARTEMAEKASAMKTAIVFMAGSALLLHGGFLFLLLAAVGGLMLLGMGLGLASAIVAAVSLVLGGIALWVGLNRFKAKNLTPNKTVHQLQRDAAVARYQVHTS